MTFYSKTILQPTRYYLWAVLLLLSFSYAQATFVQVSQISSPVGYVSQSEAVAPGTAYQTIQPNLTSSGYTFGYWSTDGNRLTDSDGRSITQGKITVNAATTLTAHYFLSTADTDTDGLLDWFEYRNFGNLDQNASSDSDADGFTNGQENGLGQEPTIKDSVQDGGISSRQSSGFVFADSSMVHYLMKSNPIGFITTTEGYVEINASVTSSNLHGATNGYHFAYWSVNGTRQAGPTGTALSQITTKLQNDATIVAHYFLSTLDGDNDSVMDWFELNQFGDLTNGPDDDPDADGFKNSQESDLGQEANIKDSVQDGGISSRKSSGFVFADSSMVKYTIKSNPIGFISSSAGYVEINASVSTQTLNGAINGYHFAYWTVNGIRQHGPTGVALSQINPKIENDSNLIAHYFLSTLDSDNDSVMDWFEYNQFGDLSNGPAGDPDADGFTNSQESALGQEANIKDSVQDGGISSRISGDVLFFLQVNNPPSNLQLSSSTVHTGKAAGELVGTLIPTDPDHDPGDTYQISFLDGNGSTDRDKFSISNLNLVTTDPLPVGSYFINLRVSDDENESLDKNFTISSIHDPNKDDDNDGLTYAQEQALGTSDNHADSDGDGFSDLVESNYGSNPTDANSTANAAPTDLNNSAPLSFFENQPIGTVIGDFNATDPDANATLSFSISGPNAPLFSIDQNGTLFTNTIFDFENNASSYSLEIKVSDDFNSSDQISRTLHLQNRNESPMISGITNTTFPENQPAGYPIGNFNTADPDANSTLTLSLLEGNSSNSANLFSIDQNGTLRTTQSFDYEKNSTSFAINVIVTDEMNASNAHSFNLSLQNIIEDLDGDGTEDYFDLDDDGDGFADLDEIAHNSDPRDPKSFFNRSPVSIDLNGSSIPENAPAGSYIGKFNVVDPDTNAMISYNLHQISESNVSYPFTVDANGTLRTTRPLDFENGPSQYSIKVRVSDEWNASIEKEFTIQILDLDENAPIVSLLGESVITLLTTDPWIDPGATWTDQKDGNGTIFSQNDLNQTHPTFEEWVQNGKKLPEGMVFTGGTPWFDENTGQNRDDKEVYDMLFGIQTGEYKLNYVYKDQAGNLSNLVSRTLLIIHPTKPIVQTLNAIIDENGSVQFGAEIRSGAKMELIETGIHYGTDQIFSEFNQVALSLSTITDQYFSTPLKPRGNNQIFYRAYARNKAGTSYGSVKTLTLPSESNATVWWSGSIEEQGGWQTSPWFGSFRRYPQGWIFHADLNWLYAYAGESGDVWLWSQDHGWLWTGPDVYPHLFNHGTANWFYFLKKQDGIPKFYDYSTESVK
jgi:hypothetical protein